MKSKLQVVRLSGKAQTVIFILTQVCSEQISLLNVILHNNVQHIKKRSEEAYVKRDNVLLWSKTHRLNKKIISLMIMAWYFFERTPITFYDPPWFRQKRELHEGHFYYHWCIRCIEFTNNK